MAAVVAWCTLMSKKAVSVIYNYISWLNEIKKTAVGFI